VPSLCDCNLVWGTEHGIIALARRWLSVSRDGLGREQSVNRAVVGRGEGVCKV
jgi:hypothetical protein